MPRGGYLLLFDPLGGSSNSDVNISVGTIFSVLRHPNAAGCPTEADSEETNEFAINASNRRHWFPPIRRYVDELEAGKEGPRGRDYNMRWVGSMVADVHRILTCGAIFLYPTDRKNPNRKWRVCSNSISSWVANRGHRERYPPLDFFSRLPYY